MVCIVIIYVGIPHDKLILCNNKSKFLRNYSKDSLIDVISFLINNCSFNLGSELFRQIIGIFMGSDPAPTFANLFLFLYESSWFNDTKKSNNILSRKFD